MTVGAYLLPSPRTPGDHAHLNRDGSPLCKVYLPGVWLDDSDYLCAFNVCPECERVAQGKRMNEWVQAQLFEVAL